MDSRPWHEQLRIELHQQGLPATYIDRLVEELADHAVDSQTENTSMDAQQACAKIGTTTELAAAARREFDQRTFAGRHPVLTFVLGPIAVVPLLFVSLMAGTTGILWIVATATEWLIRDTQFWPSPETETLIESWLLPCYDSYCRFLPFALAALIFCRWGRHCQMPRWSLLACTITALIAGLFVTKLVPSAADHSGLWIMGFSVRPNLRQLLQLLAPLVIAAWFLLRIPSPFAGKLRLSPPG
jgi:hypothetical protein